MSLGRGLVWAALVVTGRLPDLRGVPVVLPGGARVLVGAGGREVVDPRVTLPDPCPALTLHAPRSRDVREWTWGIREEHWPTVLGGKASCTPNAGPTLQLDAADGAVVLRVHNPRTDAVSLMGLSYWMAAAPDGQVPNPPRWTSGRILSHPEEIYTPCCDWREPAILEVKGLQGSQLRAGEDAEIAVDISGEGAEQVVVFVTLSAGDGSWTSVSPWVLLGGVGV